MFFVLGGDFKNTATSNQSTHTHARAHLRTHAAPQVYRTHARTRMHSTYLGQRFPVSARFTAAIYTVRTERPLEVPQPCVVWHAAWSIPPRPTPKRPSPHHGTRVVLTLEEQRGRKKRRSASAVFLMAGRHVNYLEHCTTPHLSLSRRHPAGIMLTMLTMLS